MSRNATEVRLTPHAEFGSAPTRPVTLRDVLLDCGGPLKVASAFGLAASTVYGWSRQGHVPLSDLQGKTTYSEKLAEMQIEGRLAAAEIRRLGLHV